MTRLYIVLSLLLTAAAFVATLIIYPQLPETIPTHWNIQGEVDGHSGRMTVWLMPAVLVGLLLLLAVLPWLSPKHFGVDSFRSTYWFIVLVITGKGTRGGDFERGVLRRQIPFWLRSPQLRDAVLGFETAGPAHGGDGAFYVLLRRARS